MTEEEAAEIRRRLDEVRKASRTFQDMQRLLMRYAMECLFRRLARSSYRDDFVLKGALLFVVYMPEGHRNTKDADFQLYGRYDKVSLVRVFREICSLEENDGIQFAPEGVDVKEAGAKREYPGYVVTLPARLGPALCQVQIDIGFGEHITPAPQWIAYPSLIGLSMPRIRVYPLETVVAEKFEALVQLGMRNGRMKDFYDLATPASVREFDGERLAEAVANTFTHRKTPLPISIPIALTDTFTLDKSKIKDWKSFHTRHALRNTMSLSEACARIREFVLPVAHAVTADSRFQQTWAAGKWHDKTPGDGPET